MAENWPRECMVQKIARRHGEHYRALYWLRWFGYGVDDDTQNAEKNIHNALLQDTKKIQNW